MNTRVTSRWANAFTVVELITVVAIVVVLSAMVLPALSNARTRSGAMVCAANQKHLVLAMSIYAADNSEVLPPTQGWRNRSGSLVDLAAGGYWPAPSPDIGPTTPIPVAMDRIRDALTKGPLWTYASNAELYQCPSDARARLSPGRGWTFGSYSKVNGVAGLDSWSPSQRPFRKTTDAAEPSMSFVFVEESDPRGYNLGAWILDVLPPGWVDPVAVWHDTGSNASYLDGHQDYHRWTDARTIAAARNSDRGMASFFWPGGNAGNPDFRWVWDRYRYLGWKPLP